jgi:hypothetical protein
LVGRWTADSGVPSIISAQFSILRERIMNRIKTSTLILGLTILAIPLFMAAECQITGSFRTFDTTGEVIDARDSSRYPDGVGGVTITLTSTDNDSLTYSGTTSADGEFDVRNVESGSYRLTAEKDGWFIPSRSVDIGQQSVGISEIPAFQLEPNDVYGLSFILMWNDLVEDVDIHMSYPDSWDGTIDEFSTPYDNHLGLGTRERVYWEQMGTPSSAVYMDRDDQEFSGPETLTLRKVPHGTSPDEYNMYGNPNDDVNGLYTAFNGETGFTESLGFGWIGSAVVYLNTPSTNANLASSEGSNQNSAEARIYAFQTLPKEGVGKPTESTDLTAEYLGLYRVPEFTTLESARMIRINMLEDEEGYPWFQIVPEIEAVPEGPSENKNATFQSTERATDGIIGVRGKKRNRQ